MSKSILAIGLMALGAAAQSTTAYTDADTGITFQGYSSTDGMQFGIAVSDDVTSTDFIGQIEATITEGWAGVSFTGTMANALLIAVYPNGDDILASLRTAVTYTNPDLATVGTLMPIENGTYVNSTAIKYTFLCSACIQSDGSTFTMDSDVPTLAWVMSKTALDNPSDADAVLNYHDFFGIYGFNLTAAMSADFTTWSALASTATTTTTTPSSSNTTTAANITTTTSNTTYDYIVAGAGAAGIIAAERIAEAGHSVLLLERGEASTYSTGGDVLMPWNDTVTPFDVPGVSWYLSTIDGAGDKFCDDTAGEAGCVLGGGSSVNCLLWMKPPARDFDDKWPTGWKWDDVSAAADRLYERNPGTLIGSMDGKFYDQAAYQILSTHYSQNNWTGVDAIEDPDSKFQAFTHTPYSIMDGERAGPVKTYLPLAQALPNFTLQLNSTVIRAIRTNSTITGVEVELADGSRQIVNVTPNTGRVVLASGTLSTPRILFRSGIGPATQIANVQSGDLSVTLPDESAWIESPVGERTQDHSVWQLTWNIKNGTQFSNLTSLSEENLLNPTSEMTDMFAQGNGPMAQGNPRLDAWTSITNSDGSVRYVQSSWWAVTNSTLNQVVYLTHGSTSSGVLGLTAAGVTEFTTTPWLTTDGDKEAVEKFMALMLSYSQASNSLIEWPVANATAASMMAAPASAGTHFVGSARLGTSDGSQNNGTDIVDLNGQVYGTDNLFVVDASIHPDLPTGNSQAITMVVSEAVTARILALSGNTSGNSTVSVAASSSSTSVVSSSSTASVVAVSSAASAVPTSAADDDDTCEA